LKEEFYKLDSLGYLDEPLLKSLVISD